MPIHFVSAPVTSRVINAQTTLSELLFSPLQGISLENPMNFLEGDGHHFNKVPSALVTRKIWSKLLFPEKAAYLLASATGAVISAPSV